MWLVSTDVCEELHTAAVSDCVCDINRWMAEHVLQLNNTTTEIILFTPPISISHYQRAPSAWIPLQETSACSLTRRWRSSLMLNCFYQPRCATGSSSSVSWFGMEAGQFKSSCRPQYGSGSWRGASPLPRLLPWCPWANPPCVLPERWHSSPLLLACMCMCS